MKRIVSFILCAAMLVILTCGTSSTANAATADEIVPCGETVTISESIQQVSDDLFLVITTYEKPVSARATRYTKTGGKTYTLVGNNGQEQWTFTMEATFIITSGISSTCTSVSHSYQIYNNDWNYVSGSSYKSGNCAYGSAEFNHKLLGIVIETRNCNISLACDVNGNLS